MNFWKTWARQAVKDPVLLVAVAIFIILGLIGPWTMFLFIPAAVILDIGTVRAVQWLSQRQGSRGAP